MREIVGIFVHCSATVEGQHFTVEDITRWHKDRGFQTIGYHRVIYLDGSDHAGRPEEQAGAHVAGHNANTLGLCYIGGLDANRQPKDTRTPAQREGLLRVIKHWIAKYPSIQWVKGHNEVSNKACPCFDASAEYRHLVGATIPEPPIATVTAGGDSDDLVQAYKYLSMRTPIADIPAGTELKVLRELTVNWVEVELPGGGKGFLRENQIS